MSREGFKGVPGVPDGWELVEFRKAVSGDCVIAVRGGVMTWGGGESAYVYPIIRKIEGFKTYRPFANGGEFKPHRDRWVKIASGDNNCGCGITKADIGGDRIIDGCNEHSVCIWEGWMTFKDAFKCFAFDDGTPFGVEVTE
jgi:hypothetical protein